MLVEVNGITSRKELNGQLGIATAYDDAKGRLAVRLIFDRSMVSLKVDNLADWAAVKRRDAQDIQGRYRCSELAEGAPGVPAVGRRAVPGADSYSHATHSTAMRGPSQAHT